MYLIVTTNQKPIIDTQKIKRKEHKHNTKVIKSQGKRTREERNTEALQKHPKNN